MPKKANPLFAVVTSAGLLLCAGCGDAPLAPSSLPVVAPPTSVPAPAPPTLPPLPSSTLAIEEISVTVHPPGKQGWTFGYEPRFQLRETSGKSGATLVKVEISSDAGTEVTGPSCWGEMLRVPPGGTLDTFYSDVGARWLGYCGVWGGGRTQTPTVVITVTFTDDDGLSATAHATADLSKVQQ
jgi:hypothetical protein